MAEDSLTHTGNTQVHNEDYTATTKIPDRQMGYKTSFYINRNTKRKMRKKVAQDLRSYRWSGLSDLNNFRDPPLYKTVATLT